MMTEQKAKDIIHGLSNELAENEDERRCEALGMAEEALEKQIAVKPTDVRYFGEAGYYIGLCPRCKEGSNSEYQYCGTCGQKLDW